MPRVDPRSKLKDSLLIQPGCPPYMTLSKFASSNPDSVFGLNANALNVLGYSVFGTRALLGKWAYKNRITADTVRTKQFLYTDQAVRV